MAKHPGNPYHDRQGRFSSGNGGQYSGPHGQQHGQHYYAPPPGRPARRRRTVRKTQANKDTVLHKVGRAAATALKVASTAAVAAGAGVAALAVHSHVARQNQLKAHTAAEHKRQRLAQELAAIKSKNDAESLKEKMARAANKSLYDPKVRGAHSFGFIASQHGIIPIKKL